MINVTRHPDKIMAAVQAPASGYFMVVDIKTGRPQHFSVNIHRKESLGEFINSDSDDLDYLPAGIFDRETALYLIGQSAISAFIDVEASISDGNDVKRYLDYNPGFILIPVSGSCLPVPSPSIDAK